MSWRGCLREGWGWGCSLACRELQGLGVGAVGFWVQIAPTAAVPLPIVPPASSGPRQVRAGSTGHWVLALSSSSPASPSCRLDKLDASLAHLLATRSLCASKGMQASVVCFLCAADFFFFFSSSSSFCFASPAFFE